MKEFGLSCVISSKEESLCHTLQEVQTTNILDTFRKPHSTILCIVIIIVIYKLSSLRQIIFFEKGYGRPPFLALCFFPLGEKGKVFLLLHHDSFCIGVYPQSSTR